MRNRALPADLQLEIDRHYSAFFRRMTDGERSWWSSMLTARARAERQEAIRQRHPEYSEREVWLTEVRVRIGDDLFRKAFPTALVLPE